jgi:RNA polymerase sigma-70 factor (ECF subfamily)
MSAVEARRSHGVRTFAHDDPSEVTCELYRAYGHSVYRFAYHMLGNREDAEDAAQASFLSIHAALAAGTEVREPQAWVLKIARNECLGRISGRMRRPLAGSLDDEGSAEVPARGPSVPQEVELRGDVQVASVALEGLPTTQREAFVLREWLGLSTGEIADSLGTTVSAVDALLNRARRELIRAVAAGEGSAGCGQTRQALQRGLLDRRTRAHLVRCKPCRAARRAVQPGLAGIRVLVPPAAIAERLADALPGFSLAGSAAVATGAAGSGGIAALVAKSALTPVAVKTAAAAALAALAVGGATELRGLSRPSPARHASPAATAPAPAAGAEASGSRSVLVSDTGAGRRGDVGAASVGRDGAGGGVRAHGGTTHDDGAFGGGSGGRSDTERRDGTRRRPGRTRGDDGGESGSGSGGAIALRSGEHHHRSTGRDDGTDRTRFTGGDGSVAPWTGTHHHHVYWQPSGGRSGGTSGTWSGGTGGDASATGGTAGGDD